MSDAQARHFAGTPTPAGNRPDGPRHPDDAGLDPAPRPSDGELVVRLRNGDADAGETLARRHAPALLRYLHRLGGSPTLAEDLHQQTWLSVMDHLDRFDAAAPGGFKAWLYRIATNKANDHWRSAGRERVARQSLRLFADDAVPDHGQRLVDTESQAELSKAIDALPDAQKQVVLMRYYSGMKFVEIAASLGCPLNTALGRMHKAMMKLRQLLNPDAATK